jgi:hypothetical protein
MPKQGKKGKRPAASTKGNAKKKSKARGNVVGGSKLLAPQHNNGVAKQQLRNFLYDPVIPELDIACHRELNTMGSHAHFKLIGRKSKAVFHFEVRGFSEAHLFKGHGVDQMRPAFRLKDCTDYESENMEKIFGRNETDVRGDARRDMERASEATRSCTTAERGLRAPQD